MLHHHYTLAINMKILSLFSNGFCNKYNQYLIDCNKAEIAIGKRPNSALGAMLQAYLPTPSMYLQYRVCIFSGRKESKVFSRAHLITFSKDSN